MHTCVEQDIEVNRSVPVVEPALASWIVPVLVSCDGVDSFENSAYVRMLVRSEYEIGSNELVELIDIGRHDKSLPAATDEMV
jgi:hypothetical protein